jgi:Asp-tRNA(Asn)/Glu-tRNA(Gln) amidotransferase A subunit family amidase
MDLCLLTIAEMRRGLASGAFSAAELLEVHERRIEQLNPRLNAIVERMTLRGRGEGVLGGIPVTVKDSLDVAGYATVCGMAERVGKKASRHAVCVQRLLDAGAVIVGKTNTPEWLMDWETDNEVYGVTRNPLDETRSPGGSSGGESAAIAAGMSAGGVGSDGGGSIRVPAAMTGICGLKPTPGRVSAEGHFPPVGMPGGMLGVIGPMGRTVGDVETLFEVIEGGSAGDPFSAPVRVEHRPVGKVGVVGHEVTWRAAQWVSGVVEEFAVRDWERIFEVWRFFFLRVNAHAIGKPTRHTAVYLEQEAPTMIEMLEMFAARDAIRARVLRAMEEYPVLLVANPGFGAWKCGEFPGVEAMKPLVMANLLGLPALAVPVGLNEEGMPLSVQVVGRPWCEEQVIAVGKEIERGHRTR